MKQKKEGSALLLVLGVVAFLSLIVLSLVEVVSFFAQEEIDHSKEFRARLLAESGIAIGLAKDIKNGDPVLEQIISPLESFSVKIERESGRLNINSVLSKILADPQNSQQRLLLHRFFREWGLTFGESENLIEKMLDWIDGDDLKRINGGERDFYESRGEKDYPLNRPFQSLKEMALVAGMEKLQAKNIDLEEYFTVWGDGKVDLRAASAQMIAFVCDLDLRVAESFVAIRNGKDETLGTQDDQEIKDAKTAQALLAMSQLQWQAIASLVTFQSNLWRVRSVGKFADYEKEIVVVTMRGVSRLQYYAWVEP